MAQKCAHAATEVTQDFCVRMSSIPARAGKCEGCNSPWRNKDVKPADPEAGLPTTSRRFEAMGLRVSVGGGSISYGVQVIPRIGNND